jgi:hypothetical protein
MNRFFFFVQIMNRFIVGSMKLTLNLWNKNHLTNHYIYIYIYMRMYLMRMTFVYENEFQPFDLSVWLRLKVIFYFFSYSIISFKAYIFSNPTTLYCRLTFSFTSSVHRVHILVNQFVHRFVYSFCFLFSS